MKTLPRTQRGTNGVFALLRNVVAAEALVSALDCGIFSLLAEPKTAEETAARLQLHARSAERFLDLLAVCGFVYKTENRYRNTAEMQDLLSGDSFVTVAPLIREMAEGLLEPMRGLKRILRNGPDRPLRPAEMVEETFGDGEDGGSVWAFRGVAEELASVFAALPGAKSFRRMLDLGGGHGVFSLYAAEALPSLTVDVYDLLPALHGAARHIAKWDFADRVKAVPGDYLRDNLPGGYDLVFASCTLNFTLMDGATQKVMDKVYDALVPGGYCVSLHDAPPDAFGKDGSYLSGGEGIRAYPMECFAFGLVSGMDMAMPEGLVAETMLRSGFSFVHSRELRTSGGTFRLDIARKGG